MWQRKPISIKPEAGAVGLILLAYGGMARQVYEWYEDLFKELDVRIELLVPQLIYPFPLAHIERSVSKVGRLVVIEEGIGEFGWGANVVAQLHQTGQVFKSQMVGSLPVSMPSPRLLEQSVMPDFDRVVAAAKRVLL